MNVVVDGVRYVPAVEPCGDPGLLDFVWSFYDAGGDMPIRDYLRELLTRVWEEGERFSGKRPFGNSGWEYELYAALIAAKAVVGELDEDGRVESLTGNEVSKADGIIAGLIYEMCGVKA